MGETVMARPVAPTFEEIGQGPPSFDSIGAQAAVMGPPTSEMTAYPQVDPKILPQVERGLSPAVGPPTGLAQSQAQMGQFFQSTPAAVGEFHPEIKIAGQPNQFIDPSGIPGEAPPLPLPESTASNLVDRFGTQVVNAFAQIGQTIISSPFSPIGVPQKEADRFKGQALEELESHGFTGTPAQAEQLIRQRSSELAAAGRIPKIELDPAEGFAEKTVDVGAGLASFVAQLVITRKALPAGTPEAIVWEVQNQLSGGIPGQGAAMRATLGQVGKIPTSSVIGKGVKVGAESTLFAGVTAASGGNAEDIIVSALIPVAFNTWNFAKQRQHLKQFESDLRTRAFSDYDKRVRQGMPESFSAMHLKADMRAVNIAVSKAKQRIFHDDAFAPAKERWQVERQKALKMIASGKPENVKRGNAILDFIENLPSVSESASISAKAQQIEPGKRTTISPDTTLQQRQAAAQGISSASRRQAETRLRRVFSGIQKPSKAVPPPFVAGRPSGPTIPLKGMPGEDQLVLPERQAVTARQTPVSGREPAPKPATFEEQVAAAIERGVKQATAEVETELARRQVAEKAPSEPVSGREQAPPPQGVVELPAQQPPTERPGAQPEAKAAEGEKAVRDEWNVVNRYLVEHDASKGQVPARKPYLPTRDEAFAEAIEKGEITRFTAIHTSGRDSNILPGQMEHATDAIRIGEKLGYRADDIAAYLQRNYIDQVALQPAPKLAEGEAEAIWGERQRVLRDREAKKIRQNPIYKLGIEGQQRQKEIFGYSKVRFPKEFQGEIDKAIGDFPHLQFKISTKPSFSGKHYDEALEEIGDPFMDVGEFLQRMGEATKTPKTGVLNSAGLDFMATSNDPDAVITAAKFEMLHGTDMTAEQINNSIREFASEWPEMSEEAIQSYFVEAEDVGKGKKRVRKELPGKTAEIKRPGVEKGVFGQEVITPISGEQGQFFEKKDYKSPEPDVEGQKKFPPKAVTEKKKPRGATTIIPDLAAEAHSIITKTYKNPIKMARAIHGMVKRNLRRNTNYMRNLGPAGKKLADDIDQITHRVTRNVNNDLQDLRNIYKGISKPSREKVAKIVNEVIDPAKAPKKLRERAVKLRGILDNAMDEASDLDMKRTVKGKKILIAGSGKAYPQAVNERGVKFLEEAATEGKGSPTVFAWAQEQVKAGKFKDIDDAVSALQRFREQRMRGFNTYLESERVELPEQYIEWDGLHVLPHLLEKNWMTVEGVRQWGNSFGLANSRIETIKEKHGMDDAYRVKLFIETAFGIRSVASREAQELSRKIRGFQFLAKVGLSPPTILRNMFDRIPKGFTVSGLSTIKASVKYPPFINQFIRSSQKHEDWMIRSGAVFGHGSLSEGYEAGSVLTELAAAPFSTSERGNQVFIAMVQYDKFLRDLATLKGKDKVFGKIMDKVSYIYGHGTGQIKHRIKEAAGDEVLRKAMAGEELNQEEIEFMLHKAVRDRAFPMVLSTKPIWYDNHPFMKVLAQFKTWPLSQTNLIWRDVIKYTAKTGDFTRLARFLLATLLAGELYNILRDFLFDKEESVLSEYRKDPEERKVAWAILKDLFDGGMVGVFADLTYGIYDWATGVSARTAKNVWETGLHIAKTPRLMPHALERLAEKEITPYRQIKRQVEKADRKWFNEGNMTQAHYKWRAESWKFRDDKEHPTVAGKAKALAERALTGLPDYPVGENTLALDLAHRQVIAGDVRDAAKYLRLILKGKEGDERKKAITSIKASRSKRSPLGPIAEEDMAKFKKGLSVQSRTEATDVQLKYIQTYQEALKMAASETKGTANK